MKGFWGDKNVYAYRAYMAYLTYGQSTINMAIIGALQKHNEKLAHCNIVLCKGTYLYK